MSPLSIAFSLFISGLAFGFGPCLASCGPVLISYVAGTGKNTAKGLLAYLVFSLARMSAYCILALVVYFAGQFALENFVRDYVRYVYLGAGIFVIALGILTMFGKAIEFAAWNVCRRTMLENDTKSIALMGFAMGLMPCGPLIAILSYIGLVSKTALMSTTYSLAFGLGTILSPLAALIALAGLATKLRARIPGVYEKIFHAACGAVVVYFGVQLIRRGF